MTGQKDIAEESENTKWMWRNIQNASLRDKDEKNGMEYESNQASKSNQFTRS